VRLSQCCLYGDGQRTWAGIIQVVLPQPRVIWEAVGPVGRHHWVGRPRGRPTVGRVCLAQFSVRWLLGGPPCDIHVQGPVLRWFRCSSGPVDPRECVWFVERVLSRIDDVSPCLWAAFLLMWGYLVGHLILVCSCAFCLDLWSLFSCSWSVFSPLFHLHTNNYQHSWKWSVINPYHYVDVCISCVYAGVDGLDLVLSSRQQLFINSFVLCPTLFLHAAL